jgi:23S rRNA (pseudouridine1915-N3)-methyltransferase
VKLRLFKESKVSSHETGLICSQFQKKAGRYLPVEAVAGSTLKKKPQNDFLVCLDERGKNLGSKDWASLIQKTVDDTRYKSMSFVIGGAYGLSDIQKSANELVCISPMVLAGDIAWIVLHEQIYRALSIMHGSKYHHS